MKNIIRISLLCAMLASSGCATWHQIRDRIDDWAGYEPPNQEQPEPEPTPEKPAERPINRFLWKPVSESRGGRAAVLLPARIESADITVNGERPAENRGRTNGHRLTYFLAKTGADYGKNVTVTSTSGESWTIPDGAKRYER